MTLDAAETIIAGTGHIYLAAVGSTAPTDATTTPAAAFTDFGYTTEDGVSFNISPSTDALKGWQSFFDLRRFVTGIEFSINFRLLQHNYETLKLWLLGGTSTGTGGAYHITPGAPDTLVERALIIDVIDGSKIERWYAARSTVYPDGDTQFSRQDGASLGFVATPVVSSGTSPIEVFTSGSDFSAT